MFRKLQYLLRTASGMLWVLMLSNGAFAQELNSDSLLTNATLEKVVNYAINHQPLIKQAIVDQEITEATVKTKLSDWYPQINFDYLYQHNFQVQTSVIGGNPVRLGVNNTSGFQFSATQTIFDRDVLLANRTKGNVLLQ